MLLKLLFVQRVDLPALSVPASAFESWQIDGSVLFSTESLTKKEFGLGSVTLGHKYYQECQY